MSVQVTICAPHAAHFLAEPEVAFADRHKHTVNAEMNGDGEMVSTSHISFDDYTRMQTSTSRRGFANRRAGVPLWTRNQSTVRAVLVRYFEGRAKFGSRERASLSNATEAERLKRACEKLRADVPRAMAVMDKLCAEYVALRQTGFWPDREPKLAQEIAGLDTSLRLAQENAPAVILGILYQSYNVGMDSVGVGAMFGYKPPHVRQILRRLNQTYRKMTGDNTPAPPRKLKAGTWYASLTPEQRRDFHARSNAKRKAARVNAALAASGSAVAASAMGAESVMAAS